MKRREIIRLLTGATVGLAHGWGRLALGGLAPVAPHRAPHPARAAQQGEASQRGDNGRGATEGGERGGLLALFPLRVVLLPGNSLPLHIFEPRYREMIRECIDSKTEFGVLLTDGGAIEPVGCTAIITDVIHQYTDGRFDILTRGQRRFRIGPLGNAMGNAPSTSLDEADLNSDRAFFRGAAQFFEDDARPSPNRLPDADAQDDDLRAQAIDTHSRLMKLIAADEPSSTLPSAPPPSARDPLLSYHLMDGLPAEAEWKQELLELRAERERLVRVVLHLQQLIDYMESDSNQPAPRRVV